MLLDPLLMDTTIRYRMPATRTNAQALTDDNIHLNSEEDDDKIPGRPDISLAVERGVTGIRRTWMRRRGPCSRRFCSDTVARLYLNLKRFLLCRRKQLQPRSLIFPGYDIARIENADSTYGPSTRQSLQAVQETYSTWRIRSEPPSLEANVIRNQKYSLITFLPLTLINQFRYFFNIFYLLVGLSQLAPQFQIGPLFTYLAPLSFVIAMSLCKEAIDDIKRWRRDREINSQVYEVVAPFPVTEESVPGDDLVIARLPASEIRVGHLLRLHANQRVPCDALLLKTLAPDSDGTTFIRTDQLDGETDWKLRRAVECVQTAPNIFSLNALCDIEAPRKEIYGFCGVWSQTKSASAGPASRRVSADAGSGGNDWRSVSEDTRVKESLGLENTLWTNSIVTAGPVLALAIFTGSETRAALHSTRCETKIGKFDLEVNRMSKLLCAVLLVFSLFLTNAKPLGPLSSIYFIRFVLLLSSIIPISLRVNLDMAKIVYSVMISKDKNIAGTVVRNSTLPEELGRIDVLFSDKTGTITKNKMTLQRIGVSGKVYEVTNDRSLEQLRRDFCLAASPTMPDLLLQSNEPPGVVGALLPETTRNRSRSAKVRSMITALAVCHSVVPCREENSGAIAYQASSPDEMALVNFASQTMQATLTTRIDTEMTLVLGGGQSVTFDVLEIFPFNSARKRMSIIVRERCGSDSKIYYLCKGAEVVVVPRLASKPQWLLEEIDAFSRSGLRTLVFSRTELTPQQLQQFRREFLEAKTALVDREAQCSAVIDRLLEKDMELLGVTGVEDELQDQVAETIETLGQAGIKIWMLTGDKIETAQCIATSAGLKSRHDTIISLTTEQYPTASEIAMALNNIASMEAPAVTIGRQGGRNLAYGGSEPHVVICVDGGVLDRLLNDSALGASFVARAARARGVLCCRCSPTQKAQIVEMVKRLEPSLRLAAVGDGGNDVPMIQTAHCGIGIVGLEGKQASLASDFSITDFRYLKRLLLWHGRLAHQRSAKLSGFVIHRGLVISVIQVIFSAIFYYTPLALFQGWLQVGYSTYYTMLPVFSLVLDLDLPESVAFLFPELYTSQKREGGLCDKMFFKVLFKSIYQGAVIMLGVIALFERQMMNLVSIAFTSLILAELLNVTSEIMTWHPLMAAAELLTVLIYSVSLLMLREYFDIHFIMSSDFWSKVAIITLASWLPVHSYKAIKKTLSPPRYAKLLSS